ncbi:MAG: hemerythrin domain-containing protein [Sphingomicrobium sp.]
MTATDALRRQHDAALVMSGRLVDLIDAYSGDRDAYEIEMQLNKLLGLLRIHLAQEDVQLYPKLSASDDQEVARLARSYADEMGGLATELEIFVQHWSCSASIAGRFEEFREDAHTLLLALAVRIERENRYLYPLADAAAAAAAERKAA